MRDWNDCLAGSGRVRTIAETSNRRTENAYDEPTNQLENGADAFSHVVGVIARAECRDYSAHIPVDEVSTRLGSRTR